MADRARILIVDDEPFNVDYLEQELGELGYQTDTATNGEEALERVAASPPDLVLLDVMMPGIDGLTVCRMLKEDPKTRLIPIVIMTALNAVEDRVEGIEAGADDFLSKPVDDRELTARISTALKMKRTVDEALGELSSARRQLEEHGRLDQDISALHVTASSMAPGGPADNAVRFLADRYLTDFANHIRKSEGVVVEKGPEGLVAVFQDPDYRRHAVRAVGTALSLVLEAERLNEKNSVAPLAVRLGVSSGPALVGSSRMEGEEGPRWEFTATGPAVDVASNMANRAEAAQVIGSPETVTRLEGRYRTVGLSAKPGWAGGATTAYRIVDAPGPQPDTFGKERPAADAFIEAPDVGRRGIAWPEEYAELERKAREEWGIEELYLSRSLGGGKSGALVYAVDVTSRGFEGQGILKLSDSENTGSEEEEAARHRRAIEENSEYAAEHLPQIAGTCRVGKQAATLSTIAAGGLEYALPWIYCQYDVQLSAVQEVSRGVLERWNADYGIAQGLLEPQQLLRSWLTYRLDPDEGRIHGFMSDVGLDPGQPTFLFEGHWYPNPLAFCEGPHSLPERVRLRAVEGHVHGDLHGNNILVRPAGDGREFAYFLIDLAFFESQAFLLYDHAYFEISYLLWTREAAEPLRWLQILEAIAGRKTPAADDLGLVQIVGTLRKEVSEWVDRHEANRRSYLESQYSLARVTAGLKFIHTRRAPADRLLALLYAATNLKAYLKFHDVEWPKHGVVLTPEIAGV